MGDLPGILPPDAGRAERAARDYAIAVLSRRVDGYLNAIASLDWAHAAMRRVRGWADDDGATPATRAIAPARILRARVALYLRWCRRVERGDCWSSIRDGEHPWPTEGLSADDLVWGIRWAVPLWTLAPAHDPAMGPRERRNRRPKH